MIVVSGVQVVDARVDVLFGIGNACVQPEQAAVADQAVVIQLLNNIVHGVGLVDGHGNGFVLPSEGQHIRRAHPDHPSGGDADGNDQDEPHHGGENVGNSEQTLALFALGAALSRLMDRGRGRLLGGGGLQHVVKFLAVILKFPVRFRLGFFFNQIQKLVIQNVVNAVRFRGEFTGLGNGDGCFFLVFFRRFFRYFRSLGRDFFRNFGRGVLSGFFRNFGLFRRLFRNFHRGFLHRRLFRQSLSRGGFRRFVRSFRCGGFLRFPCFVKRFFAGEGQRLKQRDFRCLRLGAGNGVLPLGYVFFFHVIPPN